MIVPVLWQPSNGSGTRMKQRKRLRNKPFMTLTNGATVKVACSSRVGRSFTTCRHSSNKPLTSTIAGPEYRNLKKVSTPFFDDKIARPVETEAEAKGKLAPIASRVLMKLLFAARMARYDLSLHAFD